MADRRVIVEIVTGSHLYGTSRPDSDLDHTGVFLPSSKDLLGLQNPPSEYTENVKVSSGPRNTVGDVDVKFFNIKNFLKLCGEGQPGCLEMLFAPKECIVRSSPEWEEILHQRSLFVSKKGIEPFVGFALSQAHKATIKGENLNALRAIQTWGAGLSNADKNKPLKDFLFILSGDQCTISAIGKTYIFSLKPNDHGFVTMTVAGRQYDPGTKTATFLNSIDLLVAKYGTRAQAAAQDGYDYKSLMHTYRLLGEAEEFLITGEITLPRRPKEVEFLKSVRSGSIQEVDGFSWFDDIVDRIDYLRDQTLQLSPLPKEVNWSKINKLCERILEKHLYPPRKSLLGFMRKSS